MRDKVKRFVGMVFAGVGAIVFGSCDVYLGTQKRESRGGFVNETVWACASINGYTIRSNRWFNMIIEYRQPGDGVVFAESII